MHKNLPDIQTTAPPDFFQLSKSRDHTLLHMGQAEFWASSPSLVVISWLTFIALVDATFASFLGDFTLFALVPGNNAYNGYKRYALYYTQDMQSFLFHILSISEAMAKTLMYIVYLSLIYTTYVHKFQCSCYLGVEHNIHCLTHFLSFFS